MTSTLDKPAAAPALAPAAALLDVGAVAELLNCSPQHVRRLADGGRMPRPLRIGTLCRWRRTDLESWLAAGCPSCRQDRGPRP
jgi:excisionase family DNA binding protein